MHMYLFVVRWFIHSVSTFCCMLQRGLGVLYGTWESLPGSRSQRARWPAGLCAWGALIRQTGTLIAQTLIALRGAVWQQARQRLLAAFLARLGTHCTYRFTAFLSQIAKFEHGCFGLPRGPLKVVTKLERKCVSIPFIFSPASGVVFFLSDERVSRPLGDIQKRHKSCSLL